MIDLDTLLVDLGIPDAKVRWVTREQYSKGLKRLAGWDADGAPQIERVPWGMTLVADDGYGNRLVVDPRTDD